MLALRGVFESEPGGNSRSLFRLQERDKLVQAHAVFAQLEAEASSECEVILYGLT